MNSSAQVPGSDQTGFLDASLRAPGKKPRIVDPEVYQSWNPFWAMILTLIVIVFFRKRESSGAPVSTAKKMFYGLILTTMSMLLMELAAWVCQLHQIRVSGLWLIATYCVITLGEVCLTPMGQSMVMKLAPTRLAGVLMGGWFCAIAIGSAFSGLLGEVQNTRLLFLLLTVAVSVVAALFWKFLPRLNQMLSL